MKEITYDSLYLQCCNLEAAIFQFSETDCVWFEKVRGRLKIDPNELTTASIDQLRDYAFHMTNKLLEVLK